jgi:uncharacterized membrane protein YbhN (UPF0104 family)
MDVKTFLRKSLKVAVPLIIGFLLLWYIYRDMDLAQIGYAIRRGVRYDILLFSLLFGLAANIVRGLRWCLLIDHLGMPYRRSNALNAVLGNYTVNLVLPRVGEIWRCGVVSRYDKVPFSKLLGTLFVDRISDTLAVGFITLCLCLSNFRFFTGFSARYPALLDGLQGLTQSVWLYITIGVIALAVWLTFRYMAHLPFIQKMRGLAADVWTGIKSVWQMKRKTLFLSYTVLLWFLYFLFFYTTFYAFDFTRPLGLTIGLIAFTMGSIAVAVPVQAGIGAWHFIIIATLVYFNVSKADAGTFALVVHSVQTLWTALCGLVAIILLPILNKQTAH